MKAFSPVLHLALLLVSTLLTAQTFTVSPSQLNFGVVTETSPDSQQVTITNNTSFDITVTGYRFYDIYGSKAFSASAGIFTISSGGSQNIWIKFSPRHNVYHNTELFILNDSHRGALRVDLLGQGRYSNSYYNNSQNLAEEILKDTLKAITGRNYFNAGYNTARDAMFMIYDNKKVNGQGAAQNTIECVYTGRNAVGYFDRTDCQTNYSFNTEHVFPQGFFNSLEPMRADLYHLFPTDDAANNVRASNPFGVVANPSWTQGGSKSNSTTFEPRDIFKGPAARAMLYFVIRYQNYSNFMTNQEGILRQWHQQYPPNTIEVDRCNDIFTLQLNRNPFVDYPQFTERITSFSNTSVGNQAASSDFPEDTIDFGLANAAVPNSYTFWIANDGNMPLNISGLTLNSASVLSFMNSTGSNVTIPPGEAIAVEIELANAAPGSFSGTLNFTAQGTGLLANVSVPIKAQLSLQGIAEMGNGHGLTLFPNPASERICIAENKPIAAARVLDLSGRIIRSLSISEWPCFNISAIENAGFYVLEWEENGKLFHAPWVKVVE
ncbi:MAG: endonuclease [Bacteroidetes bacterium]|nr:endonuclease [Bacteroidota bacterium]